MASKSPLTLASVKDGERYTVAALAEARANVRGIDTSRAAKDVRGRLRANFAHVVTLDPSILDAKEHANDGNRWPTVSADVARFVLSPRANKSQEPRS